LFPLQRYLFLRNKQHDKAKYYRFALLFFE